VSRSAVPEAPALRLEAVGRRFGSLWAVKDVTMTVAAGARHAIIGPNGAGKSTLFNLIAGALPITSGRIHLFDADLSRRADHACARRGIARSFQQSSLFLSLSALENVSLAVQRSAGIGMRFARPASRYAEVAERADAALTRVGLASRAGDPAGALSHGERRQLEVAVGLAAEPSLFLLDEPTAGTSAEETELLTTLIEKLPASVTVVIVEHDLDVVFRLASEITVLHLGEVLASGSPEAIRDDPRVHEVYLGAAESSELFTEQGTA
jgi:branched-chain amino acid transport system ATP-binding protein